MGYVIYLTAYNKRYYRTGKYNYHNIHPGHIATCYPTPDYLKGNSLIANIVQAGGSWGITTIGTVWSNKWYIPQDKKIKAHIYLGYILK